MNTLVRTLFRSLEQSIHERLAMIEDVISGFGAEKEAGASDEKTAELTKKIA